MNILILAYACEPFKGSEQGVGWNLSMELSKLHNITVLTRRNNKTTIENYLNNHNAGNITFVYHDLPDRLMWLKKIIGVQAYYILWNLTARSLVNSIVKNKSIDLIHHLTFNQYRTPSVGYFINKPFIIGPVGGAEIINRIFDKELKTSTLKRENYRRKGSDFGLFKWLGQRSKARKAYVFSAKEDTDRLSNYINKERDLIKTLPAIAIEKKDFVIENDNLNKNHSFNMIYAGRAIDWKGLHVFLIAFSFAIHNMKEAKATLIGIRTEEERQIVKKWIDELDLSRFVELIDFMPRKELIRKLVDANLFVYPAFRDSGSMAVLEACAMGCPSIVFDAGGQDAFPDNTIIKVKIEDTLNNTINAFSNKLVWAYNNSNTLSEYGKRAKEFAMNEMTWEKRAEQITEIYNEIKKI